MRLITVYNIGQIKIKVELNNNNELVIDGDESNFYLPFDISSIDNIGSLINTHSIVGCNLGKMLLPKSVIIGYVLLDLYTVIYQVGLFKELPCNIIGIYDVLKQADMFTMSHLIYNRFSENLAYYNSYNNGFISRYGKYIMINSDIQLEDPVLYNIEYFNPEDEISLYDMSKLIYSIAVKLFNSVKNNIERNKGALYIHRDLSNNLRLFLTDWVDHNKIPLNMSNIVKNRVNSDIIKCNVIKYTNEMLYLETISLEYGVMTYNNMEVDLVSHKGFILETKSYIFDYYNKCGFENNALREKLINSNTISFDELVKIGTIE